MANITEWWTINNSTKRRLVPPITMKILTTGIPITTILVNLPAILMIIWITVRKENAKNLHLLSVGITDAMVGLFAYLMAETYSQTERQFSYYNCWIRYYMFSVTFVASMLHVLGICVQRLKIVVSSVQQVQQERKIIEWGVISISWSISLIVNTLPFVIWAKEYDLPFCSIDTLVFGHERQFNFYVGTVYAIIILLVVVTMGLLFRLLWIRRKKLPGNSWGPKDIKLCATVGIMAIIFLISSTPLTCILLSYDYLGDRKRTQRGICALISLLNSTVNPAIYLFRVKEFRDIFKRVIRCGGNNSVFSPNADQEPCHSRDIKLRGDGLRQTSNI